MKKQTRNLLIAIIAFVLIIVLATVLYNQLAKDTPTVSYAPVLREVPQTERAMGVTAVGIDVEKSEGETEVLPEEEESDEVRIPDIPLYRLDGSETSFYEVAQGKPVVLNYFASWCPPCQAEMPHFVEAYRQHKDDVTFLFLDALDGVQETLPKLKNFISKYQMDESTVYYDEGIFAYIFDTNSLPTTVFFYADGAIAGGQLGMMSEEHLHLYIDEITSEALRSSR